MKLIHCADIHLDSPMQTHMTAQQASVRNTEMLQSFVRLTEFAQERAVRAVLIAGDLFDGARVRARTVDALLAAIRRTPEVDYLYLPGNHDEAANAFCDCALRGISSCSERHGRQCNMTALRFPACRSERTRRFMKRCRIRTARSIWSCSTGESERRAQKT